jgi:cytoskeletal protein RodZ
MQSSTDADARRPVIIYIIVAVVLFAALILGVRWAKSRSAYYAQHQSGQNQPVAEQGSQQASPSTQGSQQTPSTQAEPSPGTQTSSNTASSTPAASLSVPSTGAEDFIVPIISLSLVTFAGASYMRARKRLQSLPQAS